MSNQNKVTLLGYYGGDQTHALSAWQSTGIELGIDLDNISLENRTEILFDETVKNKKKSMPELLEMLANAGHHSPFEKSALHFQVQGEIASSIHAIKHRVGTAINSESARYKELTDQWYIPNDWNVPIKYITNSEDKDVLSKFLHGLDFEAETWGDVLEQYAQLGHALYHKACAQLTPELGRARAKESARFFLPYNKQLNFDMQFNFRSFMHFQGLRNSPHAQKEIREIAEMMLYEVNNIPGEPFKYSLEAFGY